MSSLFVFAALLAVLAAAAPDEDFGFEASEDFEVEIDSSSGNLWYNKEFNAYAGKVFHLVIPRDAFGKDAESFEAKRIDGAHLPFWLLFDKIGGVFWGVPLEHDLGTINLVIRAHPSTNISQSVTLNVLAASSSPTADKCPSSEDRTVLTLLIDKGVRAIKPKQRVIAINNIAKFFGLPYSAFTLKSQVEKDDITDSSVVLAGPGNLHSRSSQLASLIQVPVGCDGRLSLQAAPLVHQLKRQARDGTISEVLGLPLVGWRVKTKTEQGRVKREVEDYGSGDYVDYYEDNYDEEVYDDEDEEASSKTTTSTTTMIPTHPHRHHHGEALSPDETESSIPINRDHHHSSVSPKVETTLPILPTTVPQTTSTSQRTTEEAKTTTTTTKPETSTVKAADADNYDYDYDYDEDNEDGPNESRTIVPDVVTLVSKTMLMTEPSSTTTEKSTTKEYYFETIPPSTTTEKGTTMLIIEDTEPPTVVYQEFTESSQTTTQTSPSAATTTTTTPSVTTARATTLDELDEYDEETATTMHLTTTRQVVSSPRTTTTREITEEIEFEEKNFAPYIENRLKQMSVIAGKIFRFVIPKNTFNDLEDADNLTIELLNAKGENLTKDSWCHFNADRREIYGLPLEEDVSKWEYIVRATDKEGASVSDTLTIQVQQHRLQRVVNHEISLYMRIEKQQEFPHFVDWCLKTLRALGRIYNTNMTEITVRRINYTNEPVVFTWTNDSIPTNYCPLEEIDSLYKMLTANDRGDPNQELSHLLTPGLRVKKVAKHGLGVCETPQVPATPPTNFSPFLRNPVDHINATVGELLVFRVPDDTFYDPEDTDSRNLNISLLTADRQPIRPTNWLQFDSKNREFFGIPRKPGRSEYQLVCVDSGGLTVTDSLEIVVYPPPKNIHYNVEFSMTVETPYDTFVNSASMQRKFVEKLQEIYGDRNTSYIYMTPFRQKDHATIVTWYNKTLSTSACQHDEINRLESILKNHQDHGISTRVTNIMETEFPISKISVLTLGKCREKPIAAAPPIREDSIIPVDEKTESNAADYQYLMTFIVPAVIISIMLFLAAVAACVLYRRRRSGKMNVEEDGRQSYGNKGIPVIFQEELEEKPESGTKTPIILKDEKPPLAPPEYSKSGSLKLTDDSEPYQPPPPFTRPQDNGRQARPKPTPTYRKPPPYVPP